MKPRIALLFAGSALLMSAAPAGAEERVLRGTVAGNPGSKLIVKVQRVGGNPFRVTSFEFQRLNFTCSGDTPSGRINGKVGRMAINQGSNPFDPSKRTNVFFSRSAQLTLDRKIAVFITGVVNRKATLTTGNLGISFGDGCSADSGTGFSKFRASR